MLYSILFAFAKAFALFRNETARSARNARRNARRNEYCKVWGQLFLCRSVPVKYKLVKVGKLNFEESVSGTA
jgi:hypothetical protein